MLESFNNDKFEYQKLTQEEQSKRGILGRLVGVMADSKHPTRNGRKYSLGLWEKVFANPIMQEKIKNRVCFGEACHPTDGREEVDPEKVAICLAEVPKVNSKGQLIGVFDILNTPCGKILKTLLDYGANIGVSSRGSGDVLTDSNGEEYVDEDSYDCICWDAVFVPAVKEARLTPVMESLQNKKSLQESIEKIINESTSEDKKTIEDTLKDLNITFDDEEKSKEEFVNDNPLKDGPYIKGYKPVNNSIDTGAMMETLKQTLVRNKELSTQNVDLQEKLTNYYAKERVSQDRINSLVSEIGNLRESLNKLKSVQTELDSIKSKLNVSINENKDLKTKNSNALKDLRDSINDKNCLKESCDALKKELTDKENCINDLMNQLNESKNSYEQVVLKHKKYVEKANSLIENYKAISNKAVDKYINSQANRLGCTDNEIKNRLSESYTFADIDEVCQRLESNKLGIDRLSYVPSLNQQLTESKKIATVKTTKPVEMQNSDDTIDEFMLSLLG